MNRHIVTAVTYNIHEWIGKDGRQLPERAVRIINEFGADVIALQEVSFPTRKTHGYTIDDLARQTRMIAVPGLTLTKKHADYGNLLLTRYPIIRLRKLDLTLKAREPRGAIMATLDIHGVPCTVIGTHLGLRQRERYRQIQRIMRSIQINSIEGPIILMGDLNEWNTTGGALRILRRFFRKAPAPPSYPSRFPILSLDRILIRPRKALMGISVLRSPLARLASDHLPVKADIRFP